MDRRCVLRYHLHRTCCSVCVYTAEQCGRNKVNDTIPQKCTVIIIIIPVCTTHAGRTVIRVRGVVAPSITICICVQILTSTAPACSDPSFQSTSSQCSGASDSPSQAYRRNHLQFDQRESPSVSGASSVQHIVDIAVSIHIGVSIKGSRDTFIHFSTQSLSAPSHISGASK